MAFSGIDGEVPERLPKNALVNRLKETPAAKATVSIQFKYIKAHDGWKIKHLILLFTAV